MSIACEVRPPQSKVLPDTCTICCDDLGKGGDGSSLLSCLHWYHTACIANWFESGKQVCPGCKHKTEEKGECCKKPKTDDSVPAFNSDITLHDITTAAGGN